MTKTFKTICAVLVCALLSLTLMSCSKQKQYEKYAEKIKVAEAKEEPLTYIEVADKLGPTDFKFFLLGENGSVTWYAGCETEEDLQAKLDAGKEVPYITVTVADGKAIDAKTGVKTPEAE